MVNIRSTLTALVVLSAIFSVTNSKKKPLPWGAQPHDYETNEEVREIFNKDSDKFYGQIAAIRSSWASKLNDQFPDIVDTTKRLIQLNWWNYEEMVVDPDNGEFISEKPWFIIFMHANSYESNVNIEPLQHLAVHFEGNVQFAYVSVPMEENLAYAYEVWSWPRMFYIDELGSAHAYPYGFASFNKTKTWIEDRGYKKSPQIFKAPVRCNKYKLWWGYAKKDVRTWYVREWQPTVEFYLRKTPVTYVYDKDPTDWENIKLNQKTNRQIIFIASGFVWILEFIYDMIVSVTCPAKKEKPKSILNRKVANKMKEDEAGSKEEGKEEKKDDKKSKKDN